MNKNLIITALLVAVSCQSVSAAVPASMMSKAFTNVTSFAGSHKVALAATVGVGALLYAGYKYTREQVWVEGSCVKFRNRGLFYRREVSLFFKTPADAVAAQKTMSFKMLKAGAAVQRTNPDFLDCRAMTPAEKAEFDRDMAAHRQEHARIVRRLGL